MTDPLTGRPPETLLLTLTGKDRPGVTSSVFTALSGAGVAVLDVEQIVLRGRLILGVLVTAPRHPKKVTATVAAVTAAGGEVTEGPYEFPGGRRFHFIDPSGNELGVWSSV